MISFKVLTNFYFKISLLLMIYTCCLCLQPCQEYSNGDCIRCTAGSHLYQRQCYENVIGCMGYSDGSTCIACDTSISQLQNGTCKLSDSFLSSTNVNLLKYQTALADQYGSPSFVLISTTEALNDANFIRCNNFMKGSAYSYHISPVSNPLISVHTYILSRTQYFKILYEGAGGGLFLCIIQINMDTSEVTLSSFVAIGLSQMINNCVDYDSTGNCLGCQWGYHLQSRQCYKNIDGCISYFKTVCVECIGFNILFENRCASKCSSLSDTSSNIFYFNTVSESAILNQLGTVINTTGSSNPSGGSGTLPNNSDPYCAAFNSNNVCTKCSFRFFMNSLGICQTVDPLCNDFDSVSGVCTSCFLGYQLLNGSCIPTKI